MDIGQQRSCPARSAKIGGCRLPTLTGRPVAVPFTVTNRSKTDQSQGTLYLRLYNGVTGSQVRQTNEAVVVEAGKQRDLIMSLPTAGLAGGDYFLAAELKVGTAAEELFDKYITLAPYTIQLPLVMGN